MNDVKRRVQERYNTRNKKTKRVAAYARVSTLTEAQEESYETQADYYERLIEATEGWISVGIYADQGLSGMNANKRPQFMKMIQDALDGRIDIILCKSVSRFSRNAREAQIYIHELKIRDVEVIFEKEGISTFDSKADFLFSIFAALAQEESRSLSDNVKWSYRRLAEQGVRHVGSNHMLGYDEIRGKLTPNEDAWIVKLIFEEFVSGTAPSIILQHLREKGAKRMRSGNDFSWSSLISILQNEAYAGNRLLQKRAPQNYLTKKPDPTEPYESRFIYNDHESIVSQTVWEAAQKQLEMRKAERQKGINKKCTCHFLYGKVFCAECGAPYIRYTAERKTGKYKVWRCRGRVRGNGCKGPQIQEGKLIMEINRKIGWNIFDEYGLEHMKAKLLVSKDGISVVVDKENV